VGFACLGSGGTGNTFTVNSEAAMLALAIVKGDIVVRTDEDPNESYRNHTGSNISMADWTLIGHADMDFGEIV